MFFQILELIRRYKHLFVLALLIILSLSLINASKTNRINGFNTITTSISSYITHNVFSIGNIGALKNELTVLQDLNLKLNTEIIDTRQAKSENAYLRKMLSLAPISKYDLIATEVLSIHTIYAENFLIINKGYSDGIKVGMTVCSVFGLVGVVEETKSNLSIVRLINNTDMKIPIKLEQSNVQGILGWENDSYLYMNYVPLTDTIKLGEQAFTSVISGKYPPNILVGKVVKIENNTGTHFKKIKIKPAATFFDYTHLYVVNYIHNQQELDLLRETEQKLILLKQGKK